MPSRIRPIDFFVVGCSRCGTTSLDRLFRLHPTIEMPLLMKELHHFEMAALFDGLEPTDGYQTFHAGFGFLRPMIGAVTPSYIVFPQALERIQRYNPEAKIIALLRNPVLRAHSQWALSMRLGTATGSFRENLERELADPTFRRGYSNIRRGRYSKQIERIRSLFPAEHTHFVKSEDFYSKQALAFGRICDFLGAGRIVVTQNVSVNHLPRPQRLSAEDWHFAFELFEDDIAVVEEMLGWDCSDWRVPQGEPVSLQIVSS